MSTNTMKKLFSVLAGAGLVIGGSLAAAAPAQAYPYDPVVTDRVINVHPYEGMTDYDNPIASCQQNDEGGTCSFNSSYDTSQTISTSYGLTVGDVAVQLGFSESTGSSTQVSCTSAPMSVGEVYYAYQRGTRYAYQIEHTNDDGTVEYSEILSAFNPDNVGVTCQVG